MRPKVELVRSDPQHAFACFRREEPTFAFEWHRHVACELTLITAGRGRRFVGNHVDLYDPGDLVLLGGNLPHTWQSIGGEWQSAVVLQFRRDFLGPAVWRSPELHRAARLLERASSGLRFSGGTATAATERIVDLPNAAPLQRLTGLLELLGQLAESTDVETLAGSGYATQRPRQVVRDAPRLDRIHTWLLQRISEPVTQKEAAKLVHMSPASFSRFFRRTAGQTFVNYVNALRLNEACRLLRETDLSISEIAGCVGYDNLSYFNRRFKDRHTMTPRAYRQAWE